MVYCELLATNKCMRATVALYTETPTLPFKGPHLTLIELLPPTYH